MSIEDTELPQPFGTGGKARLLPLEEGLGKMRAAMAAKPDPQMVVAGRTSAVAMTGVEDAKARIKAYSEAGVDAIFIVGAKTREQLDALSAVTDKPIILGGSTPELSDSEYLAARGVRIALQGHAPIMAAAQAVHA
ncbi:MAG: isocitrate lyase/phosphoenolpyruvate mutase family protein, partial [Gammaproteobacteria bacterium]|nr:isocitrate lyase/phosphoenolpyruvate mutase family protein [Gammaproteobacteria bacterium]